MSATIEEIEDAVTDIGCCYLDSASNAKATNIVMDALKELARLRAENKHLREFAESIPGPVEGYCDVCNHWVMVAHRDDCLYVAAQKALKGEA